ncbi:MAG: TPM domain-containing protein [Candidatus Aminicenantes bacterium]|nr:TPM domain-containing protein [Candidatus Aminicenantes bacterium]
MRPLRLGLGLVALFICMPLLAPASTDIVIPPSPSQWATDTAGFLSPAALEAVNSQLRSYSQTTGRQVLVYIGKTTGGYPIEEFAVKAFEAWKPGRKGIDDGLVLFIMAEDRKLRIEVGYGLEGVVTDAKSSRVINEILVPRIRAGDNDGAVKGAVDSLLGTIEGRPAGDTQPVPEPSASKSKVPPIFIIIGIIILLIIFITNPSFALWLLLNILSGGRGGGGGGGFGGGRGGGFSGGGGRSGGGGASGGW